MLKLLTKCRDVCNSVIKHKPVKMSSIKKLQFNLYGAQKWNYLKPWYLSPVHFSLAVGDSPKGQTLFFYTIFYILLYYHYLPNDIASMKPFLVSPSPLTRCHLTLPRFPMFGFISWHLSYAALLVMSGTQ